MIHPHIAGELARMRADDLISEAAARP